MARKKYSTPEESEKARLEFNAYMRRWNAKHLMEVKKDPIKLAEHRAQMAAKEKRRRDKNRPKYNARARKYNATYRAAHPESVKLWKLADKVRGQAKQRALKRSLLDLYGKVCQCCGEATFEFLGLDHIYGGGRKERREVGRHYYKYLSTLPKRDDLQTMCHNCNLSLAHYGYCPHHPEIKRKPAPWSLTKKSVA